MHPAQTATQQSQGKFCLRDVGQGTKVRDDVTNSEKEREVANSEKREKSFDFSHQGCSKG